MSSSRDRRQILPFAPFCQQAEQALRKRAVEIGEEVAADGLPPGRWHPYGFAVFKLDPLPGIGSLRFHVWPRNYRRQRAEHPPVHEHEWHLAGLVLAGTYSDEIFQVASTDDATDVFLYDITSGADGHDWFKATGQRVQLSSKGRTDYGPGDIHFIEAGVFHSTPIPESTFAATLVATSASVQRHRAIAGSLTDAGEGYTRPAVDQAERQLLIDQLKEHLLSSAAPTPSPWPRPGSPR